LDSYQRQAKEIHHFLIPRGDGPDVLQSMLPLPEYLNTIPPTQQRELLAYGRAGLKRRTARGRDGYDSVVVAVLVIKRYNRDRRGVRIVASD